MKSPVWFNVLSQLFIVMLVSLILLTVDAVTAYSYSLGALVYIIPNLYFVYYAFRYSGAQNAPLIAQSFSRGESGKVALASCGFILVFRFVEALNHASLFAGFSSMIVFQWFVAARIVNARDKSNAD